MVQELLEEKKKLAGDKLPSIEGVGNRTGAVSAPVLGAGRTAPKLGKKPGRPTRMPPIDVLKAYGAGPIKLDRRPPAETDLRVRRQPPAYLA